MCGNGGRGSAMVSYTSFFSIYGASTVPEDSRSLDPPCRSMNDSGLEEPILELFFIAVLF